MNHFLALIPDDDTRDRLVQLIERLKAWGLPGRWTHPEDLHLTLLFLGDCDEDERRVARHLVGDLAGSLVLPTLRLAGLGATGGRHEPRAVYAACSDADDLCATTHRGLAEAVGLASDRGFRPHLTVCRPLPSAGGHPSPRGTWTDLLAAHGEADWGPCRTPHLALCRSGVGISRYELIERWPLIGSEAGQRGPAGRRNH